MIVWVREHPILASISGLLFIVLLYMLLHRGGSSAQTISANPGGLSDAAYGAQLAAGAQANQVSAASQVAQTQTAAALALGLATTQAQNNQTQAARDVALQQTLSGASVAQYNTAANLQASISHDTAGVQQTQISTQGAVQVAGIQADVAKYNTAAQLQLGLNTNQTSVDLANISLAGMKDTNVTNLAALQDTNAASLAARYSDNATTVAVNAGQQDTNRFAIQTQGMLEGKALDYQAQTIADQFSLAQQHENNVYGPGGIFVGINRYGGNIQSNQATIEAAILGQPGVGESIQQSSASQAQSSASLWSSIVSSLVGGATKVATAAI